MERADRMKKKLRAIWIYWLLTEKRLLKKISYLLVLLLVPVLAWGLKAAARLEAGMVKIALCCEERGGLSEEIIQGMMEEKGALRYVFFDSEEDALKSVESGETDAAWIFPEELDKKFQKMAERGRITPVIRVIEREDDVSLIFTREVLCSRLFPQLAHDAYCSFVRRNLSKEISDEELEEYYGRLALNEQLFEAVYLDGSVDRGEHYLLSPVRGLLAIWLVVCGFAAILFYQKDLRDGVYDAVGRWKKFLLAVLLQAVVLFNGGIIYLLTMGLMGSLSIIWEECMLLTLYLICIAAFCLLCGQLFRKMERIGVMIPLLVILMAVVCPVFLQIKLPMDLQAALPPYYYLLSLHDKTVVWKMVLYAAAGLGLTAGVFCLRGEKNEGKEV